MKSSKTIFLTLFVALVAGFIFWGMTVQKLPENISDTSPTAPVSFEERSVPEGQRIYQNAHYRFSLFYPERLEVSERDEGGGAVTITFQNTETVEGFQIFIVPYAKPQVTPDRIAKDIPSGVVKDTRDSTIDGATAASFYSQNVMLGETAEIWFVHGGFLYEVTTLAPLDDWLSQIMLTWRFE